MRNRYETRCALCGRAIKAGAGWLEGPPWRVSCHLCRAVEPGSRPTTTSAPVALLPARAGTGLDDAAYWRGPPLWAYQRDGAEWLSQRRAALLADEMGLGKTPQAIAALPPDAAAIVVCPAIAKGVWLTHTQWREDLAPAVFVGRQKLMPWPPKGEVFVLNYDILPDHLTGTDDRPERPTHVIIDEVHYTKNAKAKRTRKVRGLCELALASGGSVWGLTGTPIRSRPDDLWTVLDVLGLRGQTWRSWVDFRRAFGGTKGRFGTRWDGPVSASVPKVLRGCMLRRHKADVLPDLPAKRWDETTVAISEDLRHELDAEAAALLAITGAANLEEAISLSSATKDRMPALELISRVGASLATAKTSAALELVEAHEQSTDAPMIVWSRHRAPIDALASRPGWAAITGSVPAKRRTQIAERFARGELRGVAATIDAGGTGVTLVGPEDARCTWALFVDRSWNPSDNEQAEDRCHRPPQDQPVRYTTLVADHALDRHLIALNLEKARTCRDAIGAAAVSGRRR